MCHMLGPSNRAYVPDLRFGDTTLNNPVQVGSPRRPRVSRSRKSGVGRPQQNNQERSVVVGS